MKFLVFTTDVIPVPGLPTSGTALRTFGLVQGLRSQGHEVVVSVPQTALESAAKTAASSDMNETALAELRELRQFCFDATNQPGLIGQVNPDVIVCGHWPALTASTRPSQAVVVDLAGPHMLERHYQRSPNQNWAVLAKLGVLSKTNYFIVSGPTQRLYFLSYLLRAQIPEAEKRIATITMPLDPNLPDERQSVSPEFPHFLFGGVFLPWQDPSFGLEQLADVLQEKGRGRLTMIGGEHPSYKLKQGVYANLFERFANHPQIETSPMLPYAKFIERIGHCDVAIDLMKWNLERQLAVTIRSTSFLWSGVPIIYNDYADLSHLIRRYDAGWCIPPNDKEAFRAVCEEIFSQPDLVRQKSANARRLAIEEFSWDRAVRPLLNILGTAESKPAREVDIMLDFPENAQFRITKEEPVHQLFVCRLNGLSRVEFRLATHGSEIKTPIRVALSEVETSSTPNSANKRLIAQEELQPADIENNEWHQIDIAPEAGSAGSTYMLSFETEENVSERTASPWAVRGAPYPLVAMYHGTKKLRGTSLCFRTTCASG